MATDGRGYLLHCTGEKDDNSGAMTDGIGNEGKCGWAGRSGKKKSSRASCFGGSARIGVYFTAVVLVISAVLCTGNPVGERTESGDCSSCRPHSTCEASDVLTRPKFFDSSCCGRCGAGVLEDWCMSLTLDESAHWASRNFCPWRTAYSRTLGGKTLKVRCAECQPQESCRARMGDLGWTADDSNFNACCGACGVMWRWRWCRAMESSHEYSKWGLRGMCPISDQDP